MFKVDAVIFDLDGTLLDSRGFGVTAVLDAFRELRERYPAIPVPSPDRVLAQIGKPFHHFYRDLLPPEMARDSGVMDLLHELSARRERAALASGSALLFDGAIETLARLSAAGLKMATASNCSEDYLESVARAHGLGRYIAHLDCIGSSGRFTKTNVVARGIAKLGATSAAMVGDRRNDLEAARANGCIFIAAAYGIGTADETAGADARISSLHELPALLGL